MSLLEWKKLAAHWASSPAPLEFCNPSSKEVSEVLPPAVISTPSAEVGGGWRREWWRFPQPLKRHALAALHRLAR